MPVIALGGLTGGGGRALGPLVAEKLGADYVDRLILTAAARHMGATVEALHQREQRPPTRGERFSAFLQRVLERSAMTGAGGDPYFGPGTMGFLTHEFEDLPQPTITKGHELEDNKYIQTLRNVITEMANRGNVVIVSRGSTFILKDNPKVLRVGPVANMEDRIQRIMRRERIDHETAKKTMRDRDAARAYFYKRFFNLDNPDDPLLYHLVINTSEVAMDYAVQIIVDACHALEEGKLARNPSVVV